MIHDEKYVLTPFAVAAMAIGDQPAQAALDAMELHMRRHYNTEGLPAIILDNGKLLFATIQKGPKS